MSKFVPESVLEKLVVGAHVRYIPNYECKRQPYPSSEGARYGTVGHESTFDAENKTGTIISTTHTTFAGHPYAVAMDVPYRFAGETWPELRLAADELALVEDEDNGG